MTELETIKRAKMYMDKLAEGINPLSDEPVDRGELVCNDRISKCFRYISGVLEKVIEAPAGKKPSRRRRPFYLPREKRDAFKFSEESVVLSKIIRQLNELADLTECKKLTYSVISEWLLSIGLFEKKTVDGKEVLRPTEEGIEIGIVAEPRLGQKGYYTVIVYDRAAQQFIVDNLDAFCTEEESEAEADLQKEP